MNSTERLLFERFKTSKEPTPVFIVQAPRVGATLFSQLMINSFGLDFLDNFTCAETPINPIVGMHLAYHLGKRDKPVKLESDYGKTTGLWEPNEGSALFRRWFDSCDPAESSTWKCRDPEAIQLFFRTAQKISKRPMIVKNAWNSFRIHTLAKLFPKAQFIWVRRDLRAAALSDLRARYLRGGTHIWNSATTVDYKEIQTHPYWEQVVLQQCSYRRAIFGALSACAHSNSVVVWYEDICRNPVEVYELLINTVMQRVRYGEVTSSGPWDPLECSDGTDGLTPDDIDKVTGYIEGDDFEDYRYQV
jgi:hypothetical protein